MKLKMTVNQTEYEIDVEVEKETSSLPPTVIGGSGGAPATAPVPSAAGATGVGAVIASLTGSMARIFVAEGDKVEAGQVLLALEAMKMETEVTTPAAGTASAILVRPGGPVQSGQGLIEL